MDRTQLSPPMLRKLTAIIRTADAGRAVLEPETRTLLALGARYLVDLSRTNLRDQVSGLPLLRVTIRERGRCPTFAWRCWAYSEDHALEKFADDPCAEDWHVKRIARVPANAADVRRMKWHTVNQPACIP